jgi:hypothetical protein
MTAASSEARFRVSGFSLQKRAIRSVSTETRTLKPHSEQQETLRQQVLGTEYRRWTAIGTF